MLLLLRLHSLANARGKFLLFTRYEFLFTVSPPPFPSLSVLELGRVMRSSPPPLLLKAGHPSPSLPSGIFHLREKERGSTTEESGRKKKMSILDSL